MGFPIHRSRRLRRSEALRRMVRETELSPGDFIYPLFVVEGRGVRRPIASMPGVFNLSMEHAVEEAKQAHALGVPSVHPLRHPGPQGRARHPGLRRATASSSGLREIKSAVPELQLMADVCLCEYTDHGHCGVHRAASDVDNDATLPLLAQMAVTCARRARTSSPPRT